MRALPAHASSPRSTGIGYTTAPIPSSETCPPESMVRVTTLRFRSDGSANSCGTSKFTTAPRSTSTTSRDPKRLPLPASESPPRPYSSTTAPAEGDGQPSSTSSGSCLTRDARDGKDTKKSRDRRASCPCGPCCPCLQSFPEDGSVTPQSRCWSALPRGLPERPPGTGSATIPRHARSTRSYLNPRPSAGCTARAGRRWGDGS
jgi:hypothetical protein